MVSGFYSDLSTGGLSCHSRPLFYLTFLALLLATSYKFLDDDVPAQARPMLIVTAGKMSISLLWNEHAAAKRLMLSLSFVF